MTNKYVGAAKFITNLFKGGKQKTTKTINTVPMAKNLTTKKQSKWQFQVKM